MAVDKKEKLLVEIADIQQKNNGELPRGTLSQLAKKYEISTATTTDIYQKIRGLSRRHVSSEEARFGNTREPIIEEDLSLVVIKNTLSKMEGAIEGLSPFHSRLANYMLTQLNVLYRYFYVKEHGVPLKLPVGIGEDRSKFDLRNKIDDRKIMDEIEEEPNDID